MVKKCENFCIHLPRTGSGIVRIDPLHFLARCHTRRLNQVYLCLSYILACFIALLFIRAPFYVLLVFIAMYSVFWLFWLSYQYLPSDWLERLLWGSLNVSRGSSPESPGWWSTYDWFIILFHCFIMCLCCSPVLRIYIAYCCGTI